MALRNSTKGSTDLLRTKKNEIIFNQLQKMRRNPHFLLFCGKFYLEGCVYFRFFFAFYVKQVHLKAVLCGIFFFSCIFRPTLRNRQLCVNGKGFSQILCYIPAIFRETAISEKFAETLCVVLFSLLGQWGCG